MKYVDVNIHKPLGGTYVAIRDIYIKQAIKEKKWLRITIPQGVGEHDPWVWVNTGKLVTQVFKIPDHPMILYRNVVEVGKKYKETEACKACKTVAWHHHKPEPVDLKTALAKAPLSFFNDVRAILHK